MGGAYSKYGRRETYKVLVGKPEGWRPLGSRGVDGRIISKWMQFNHTCWLLRSVCHITGSVRDWGCQKISIEDVNASQSCLLRQRSYQPEKHTYLQHPLYSERVRLFWGSRGALCFLMFSQAVSAKVGEGNNVSFHVIHPSVLFPGFYFSRPRNHYFSGDLVSFFSYSWLCCNDLGLILMVQ
jgi:hypothetical protein